MDPFPSPLYHSKPIHIAWCWTWATAVPNPTQLWKTKYTILHCMKGYLVKLIGRKPRACKAKGGFGAGAQTTGVATSWGSFMAKVHEVALEGLPLMEPLFDWAELGFVGVLEGGSMNHSTLAVVLVVHMDIIWDCYDGLPILGPHCFMQDSSPFYFNYSVSCLSLLQVFCHGLFCWYKCSVVCLIFKLVLG